ncbi:MAG TPA: methylmalonyl Co-A mutase-associated GTPase MeaB [Polyangiaceae bacterium]|nr:methylmalonyl Co-A mutase-associated GTPase MeaB [Polyangiaceae bacterium]
MSAEPVVELASGVRAGDRRALAKAITLVESTRRGDEATSEALLAQLLPFTGRALRLGVSGAAGAGKSSLIEVLGCLAIAEGKRVGVLAVDPSSGVSGGSLLGDRTRMTRLSSSPTAFVRPSPSAGGEGGLSPRTREVLLVLEAAGYDLIVVETVGIGQGELAIADVVDQLVVLWIPGAGDDVQGMKRGIVEYADCVVFGKADGERLQATLAARDELQGLFAWMRRDGARVMAVSAHEDRGIAELWTHLEARFNALRANGELDARRRQQRARWLQLAIERALLDRAGGNPVFDQQRQHWAARVERGEVLPSAAARHLALLL